MLEKSSAAFLETDPKPDTTLDPYCMVVTRWFNEKNHVSTTLEIKSPHLISALRNLVSYYPDNSSLHMGDIIKIEDPPALIYHYRNELQQYALAKGTDAKTKLHITYVLKYLHVHMGEQMVEFNMHLAHGLIAYKYLWMPFRSGGWIYHPAEDELLFFEQGAYGTAEDTRVFELKCHRVNYNGEKTGLEKRTLVIPAYDYPREVTALPVYPLEFHNDPEGLQRRLTARAKVFLGLRGVQARDHKVQAT